MPALRLLSVAWASALFVIAVLIIRDAIQTHGEIDAVLRNLTDFKILDGGTGWVEVRDRTPKGPRLSIQEYNTGIWQMTFVDVMDVCEHPNLVPVIPRGESVPEDRVKYCRGIVQNLGAGKRGVFVFGRRGTISMLFDTNATTEEERVPRVRTMDVFKLMDKWRILLLAAIGILPLLLFVGNVVRRKRLGIARSTEAFETGQE